MIFYKKTQTVDGVVKKSIKQRDHFLKEFLSYIDNYNIVCLFQHINPDADCVGGVLGLKQMLKAKYPKKKIYAIGSSKDVFPWLNAEYDEVPNTIDLSKALAIIIDVGSSERIFDYNNFFKLRDVKFGSVIRIDHHDMKSDVSLDLDWDDGSYIASCCQLVQICEYFGWDITPKAATYFYLGIVGDSGFFSYETVVPRSLILAAKTMRYKADHGYIANQLKNRSWNDIKVNSEILKITKKGDNLLWAHLNKAKCKELNIKSKANLINSLANIEQNIMWILFVDGESGRINVDFRSYKVSVRELAIEFGGGGHTNAAGCIIDDVTTIPKIIDKAQEIVNNFMENSAHLLMSKTLVFDTISQSHEVEVDANESNYSKSMATGSKEVVQEILEDVKDLKEAKIKNAKALKEEKEAKKQAKLEKEEQNEAPNNEEVVVSKENNNNTLE